VALAVALAVLVAVLASCGGGEDPAAACTPPAVDPTAPQVLRSGGQERRFLLAVTSTAAGPGGLPLIVSLHGHGGRAADHEASTSLAARGREAGFVVATPEALGDPRRWNFDHRPDGPDDYAFVAELIDHLVGRACVDPERVHVAGSSNGAAFAGFFACTPPGRVAAVAMVIATVPPTCPADVTPSVLTIRGTADATVPYDGAPAVAAAWADHDGCPGPPRSDEPHPGVTRTTYDRCAGGGRVALATVEGGVHAWPGSVAAADRAGNAPAGVEWSATDEVLAFFTAADRDPVS
jgi:polyhydroxybutyrate depolymerase